MRSARGKGRARRPGGGCAFVARLRAPGGVVCTYALADAGESRVGRPVARAAILAAWLHGQFLLQCGRHVKRPHQHGGSGASQAALSEGAACDACDGLRWGFQQERSRCRGFARTVFFRRTHIEKRFRPSRPAGRSRLVAARRALMLCQQLADITQPCLGVSSGACRRSRPVTHSRAHIERCTAVSGAAAPVAPLAQHSLERERRRERERERERETSVGNRVHSWE